MYFKSFNHKYLLKRFIVLIFALIFFISLVGCPSKSIPTDSQADNQTLPSISNEIAEGIEKIDTLLKEHKIEDANSLYSELPQDIKNSSDFNDARLIFDMVTMYNSNNFDMFEYLYDRASKNKYINTADDLMKSVNTKNAELLYECFVAKGYEFSDVDKPDPNKNLRANLVTMLENAPPSAANYLEYYGKYIADNNLYYLLAALLKESTHSTDLLKDIPPILNNQSDPEHHFGLNIIIFAMGYLEDWDIPKEFSDIPDSFALLLNQVKDYERSADKKLSSIAYYTDLNNENLTAIYGDISTNTLYSIPLNSTKEFRSLLLFGEIRNYTKDDLSFDDTKLSFMCKNFPLHHRFTLDEFKKLLPDNKPKNPKKSAVLYVLDTSQIPDNVMDDNEYELTFNVDGTIDSAGLYRAIDPNTAKYILFETITVDFVKNYTINNGQRTVKVYKPTVKFEFVDTETGKTIYSVSKTTELEDMYKIPHNVGETYCPQPVFDSDTLVNGMREAHSTQYN